MKMSIRTRLFLSIGCLIIFFVAFSLLMNSQFLEKYYIWQKREHLLESREMIDGIYQGNPEEISFELESLERNKGMTAYILGSNYEMKYNSSFGIFNTDYKRRISERFPLVHPIAQRFHELSRGNFFFDKVLDPRLKTEFLVLVSRLKNGELLVLSTPITAINESAVIANKFLLFTGLITVVLGGIIVYFFAGRFTKPILELNDIAQEMSQLNFTGKYPVHSDDEVGQLGNSINSLSDQLDKAISELTDANNRLKKDIERERRIDKMRKEFISNVSHELKTPLALIQGYAEGLKLNVNEDEENKDFYCDVIMDETDKMNKLVRDLLNLSQIEYGYFQLDKTAFDISCLVDRVLDKSRHMLTEQGIMLEVEKAENLTVAGDIVRIEQVLFNYLNNAINHVDDNKLIQIKVISNNDKVRVSVYNSGNPIPEEALDKIWVSFYKVDKARTRTYGGTGLGLSVVKAIMELHHCAFGVENKENGVLFWFETDRVVSGSVP